MSIFPGIEDNPPPPTKADRDKQAAEALIHKARVNDHSKFEFIRSIPEYKAAIAFQKAVAKISKQFRKSTDNLYKDYLKTIGNNLSDVQQIVTVKELTQIADFYRDEVAIAADMIDEYLAYLRAGHTIDAFMGIPRSDTDLRDFRKLI